MAYRFLVCCWGCALAISLLHFVAEVAHACGGCIAPLTAPTIVTGHRMAVAIKPDRTILWDQLSYAGAPEDFVWVLPVDATMTEVDIAAPVFLDELEAATSPLVVGPQPAFPDEGCNAGCGDDDSPSAGANSGPMVTVHSTATVGPYETATISSESPSALVDWMRDHDYAVQDATLPLIADYVAQGMSFIVVRLRPGVGVQAMSPIRVTYPGTSVSLPLRMIAAGVVDDVELTLWVFGEGRYEVANFTNALIDERDLTLTPAAFGPTSNYRDVFLGTLERVGGRAWITESAVDAFTAGRTALTHAASGSTLLATGRTSSEWRDAVEGLSPDAKLTRLHTVLAVADLDVDLLLAPATSGPDEISRFYYTRRTAGTASLPAVPALMAAGVFGYLMWWRVRRRRSPS